MNILVTGGTGLIGSALVTELHANGHKVTVLTRDPNRPTKLPPDVALVGWDGKTTEGWGHLMYGMDAVVNLAGESIAGESLTSILTRRWSDEYKARILQSRLDTGQALIAAIEAAAQKPSVLIQSSAVGYYGPHGSDPVTETMGPGDDFLAEVCAAWEDSTKAVEALGVRRVIVRTGLALSEEGGILPVMLLPFKFFAGGPVGGGEQNIPWIHMRDEVGAICFLLENESAQGAYNLTAPNPVTNAEFGKAAGEALGRPSMIPTPGFALKLGLGKKAALVLDGQRAVPERLLEAGYEFQFPELQPALQDLLQAQS